MKRPYITIGQNNKLMNISLGAGWIITAILGQLESYSRILYYAHLGCIIVLALLLIYIVSGKFETSDEMAIAHRHEAYTVGFLASCFTILLLLPLDNHFIDGGVPFNFAGYFIMGVGNLAAGWKFYSLERDGE